MPSERRNGRIPENRHRFDADAALVAQLLLETRHQQRMPAKIEEIGIRGTSRRSSNSAQMASILS